MVVSNGLGCSSCKGSKFIDEGLAGILEGLGDYAAGQTLRVCDAKGNCTMIPANSYIAAATDLNSGVSIEQVQAKYGGSAIQSFDYSVASIYNPSTAVLPAGVDPSAYNAAIADIVAGGNTYVAPKPVGQMISSNPVAIPAGGTSPIQPTGGRMRNIPLSHVVDTNIVSVPASPNPIPPGSSGAGTGTQPSVGLTIAASPGILDYLGFSSNPVDLISGIPNWILLAAGIGAAMFIGKEKE